MKNMKARAWNTKEEKWLGINLQMSLADGMLWWQFGYDCEPLSREETDEIDLMWHTGSIDTNGQEIFENDIVKHTFYARHKTKTDQSSNTKMVYEWKQHITIATIEWGKYNDGEYVSDVECWMFGTTPLSEMIFRVKTRNHWEFKNDSLKVIGNIYDTPELLERKK